MQTAQFVWNEENVAELKRRWEAGESAKTIAAAMGCERNAVLGKLYRLREAGKYDVKRRAARPVMARAPRNRTQTETANMPRKRKPDGSLTAAQIKPSPAYAPDVDYAGPAGFLQSTDGKCRAIVDGRGEDGLALICFRNALPGSQYCPGHHRRFHSWGSGEATNGKASQGSTGTGVHAKAG